MAWKRDLGASWKEPWSETHFYQTCGTQTSLPDRYKTDLQLTIHRGNWFHDDKCRSARRRTMHRPPRPTAVAAAIASRRRRPAGAPASSASCPGWAPVRSWTWSPTRSRTRSGDGRRRWRRWSASSASAPGRRRAVARRSTIRAQAMMRPQAEQQS